MELGLTMAMLGAALAVVLSGFGSAMGVQLAGRAAAGVVSEKPELFGKVLILQALAGTQGIYGFLVGIIVMMQLGVLSGTPVAVTTDQGYQIFAACLPIGIIGMFSAIFQGRTAVSAIHMTSKQPDSSAKGMTMAVLVETYAILALLISILFLLNMNLA